MSLGFGKVEVIDGVNKSGFGGTMGLSARLERSGERTGWGGEEQKHGKGAKASLGKSFALKGSEPRGASWRGTWSQGKGFLVRI